MNAAFLREMVGPNEAARMLGISTRHLLRLADAGQVPCVRTRLGRLFTESEIEAFRRQREHSDAAVAR